MVVKDGGGSWGGWCSVRRLGLEQRIYDKWRIETASSKIVDTRGEHVDAGAGDHALTAVMIDGPCHATHTVPMTETAQTPGFEDLPVRDRLT
ncbi:hypothetical protein [Burkholderia dolosa]|uniref:hypothetical protein n=1 Tax=Burkholderia dolosa TaxID=152500 RepID=UPI001C975A1D|nr:hypothetical protein [Burkholderia dolosa]MBY4832212.1 hypothetical protein [Burkholderia dolosa]